MRAAAALTSPSAKRAPMADRLVEAATRIIVRDGYGALTAQAIERESGASRSLIHYHFGGKTGLLLAVVDTLFRDMDAATPAPAEDSIRGNLLAELEADRALSADPVKMTLFVELLPHILRTEELRERLRLFYRRGTLEDASPRVGGTPSAEALKRAAHQEHHRAFQRLLAEQYGEGPAEDVSGLMAAMLDGLGLQLLIDPEGVDHAHRYGVWEDMVLAHLESRRTGPPDAARDDSPGS